MTDVPEIFICSFLQNTQLIRWISYDSASASIHDAVNLTHQYSGGQLIQMSDITDKIYYDYQEYVGQKLPPLFLIQDGYAIVTEACADVFQEFDLGQTGFHPVPLFEPDKETPVPGTFYLLNIAERKDTLIPEQSEKLKNLGSDDKPVWRYRHSATVALRSAAAEGVDLWFERQFRHTPFLSGRLVKALKAAGVRHLHPNPCRIA